MRPVTRWRVSIGLPLLSAILLLALNGTLSAKPDIIDIERSVICTCGCANMVLNTCMCAHADSMRMEIRSMIDEGKERDEILQVLVSEYGERVLASPSREGFNLTAYFMPFLVIMIGGVLLVVILRRWTHGTSEGDGGFNEVTGVADDDPYRQRLEKELRDFDD